MSIPAACRPKVWRYAAPETPIYSGSIEDVCNTCGVTILVGPMMQQKVADGIDLTLLCFGCAVISGLGMGGDVNIQSLGNPEFD